jgi:hypothetical protein
MGKLMREEKEKKRLLALKEREEKIKARYMLLECAH